MKVMVLLPEKCTPLHTEGIADPVGTAECLLVRQLVWDTFVHRYFILFRILTKQDFHFSQKILRFF